MNRARVGFVASCLFTLGVVLRGGMCAAQVPRSNLDVHRPASRNPSAPIPAPSFSRQVLINNTVRIFKLELPGHESANVDAQHHDFLVLSFGKSDFELSGDALSYPIQMEDGEIQVFKGGWARKVKNTGQGPLRLLEIEVAGNVHPEHPMCGLSASSCTDGHFGSNREGRYSRSTMFETDVLKLGRIDLGPGGTLPAERFSRAHVLIALQDMQLHDDAAGTAAAMEFSLNRGDAAWYPANVVHQLKNLGSADVELITAEFK